MSTTTVKMGSSFYTLQEFVNEMKAAQNFQRPDYQRKTIPSVSPSIFADLVFYAENSSFETAIRMPGGKVITVSDDGYGVYPSTIKMVVNGDEFVASPDGMHRITALMGILDGHVAIPSSHANLDKDAVCKKYVGRTFQQLPKKLQNAIKNLVLTVETIDGKSDANGTMQKAVFNTANCGRKMSNIDMARCNYVDSYGWSAVESLAAQMGAHKYEGQYRMYKGYEDIPVTSANKATQLIARCVQIQDVWGTANEILNGMYQKLRDMSQKGIDRQMSHVARQLCAVSDLLGADLMVMNHLVTGMYLYLEENPDSLDGLRKAKKDLRQKLIKEVMAEKSSSRTKVATTWRSYLSGTTHSRCQTLAAKQFISDVIEEMGC